MGHKNRYKWVVLGSKNGKYFHYANCIYGLKIKNKNLIFFESKNDARKLGYKCCPYCSKLYKYYEENEREIDKFLISNGLKAYIDDDSMYIDNIFSSWKIATAPDSYNLILYHANSESYHKLKTENGRLIHNYHIQNYKGENRIIDMLKYIVEHDSWKQNHMDDYKNLPTKTKAQRREYMKAKAKIERVKIKNVCNLLDRIKCENNNKVE